MNTDPKDAEIARYNLTGYDWETEVAHEGEWVQHSDHAAEIARLREERDRFEAALGRACQVGGTTYLVERAEKAEAERDAALAQVAGAYEAAAQVCQGIKIYENYTHFPSFHRHKTACFDNEENVVKVSQSFVEAIRALTPTDALAALSRRDAQMWAEGMRKVMRCDA